MTSDVDVGAAVADLNLNGEQLSLQDTQNVSSNNKQLFNKPGEQVDQLEVTDEAQRSEGVQAMVDFQTSDSAAQGNNKEGTVLAERNQNSSEDTSAGCNKNQDMLSSDLSYSMDSENGLEVPDFCDTCYTQIHETNLLSAHIETDPISGDTAETQSQESGSNGVTLTLVDLPTEILLYLSGFLESRFIIRSLCRVCKRFNQLFTGDRYWRTRISLRWPKKYPVIDMADFNWRQGCMEREEIHRVWCEPEKSMDHLMYREGNFAAIDVVHLMKGSRILATGSRDRYLNILDLSKYDPALEKPDQDIKVHSDSKTHKGWVWSMASVDSILATGSWDTWIRLWDIDASCQLQSKTKLKSAVLSLYMEPNFIAAGGYDKRLYLMDPRDPEARTQKRYHSQPVLALAGDDKYVITGSEDKTICVYDRRAGNLYKRIELESYAMDFSYGNNQLWFGDRIGKIHVCDTTDGLFDNIQTFDVGHTKKVTGIVHTWGGIFTCSTDGKICVAEPCVDPGIITELHQHQNTPVARISYRDGVLASAGSDIAVGIWMPKT